MVTATPSAAPSRQQVNPPRHLWLIWDDDRDTWAANRGSELDEPDHLYWFDDEGEAELFCQVMRDECDFNYRPIHVQVRT